MLGSLLDMHVGGGLLPHVYCRKIVLENWQNPADALSENSVKVTLRFEVLEQVNKLLESQWLNDLGDGALADSILDSMYIQIIPYRTSEDVVRLRASRDPTGEDPETGESNIYLAQSKGEGFLPRAQLAGDFGVLEKHEGHFYPTAIPESEGNAWPLGPINIRTSSLLGDLSGANVLGGGTKEGKARTEFKDGKEYYVIPFEKVYQFNPDSVNNSLGFAFYTFLHTPAWMMANGFWQEEYNEFFESYVVEGPVNTEIIFAGGTVENTREIFVLPGGKVWEGSVHLHATGDNPTPGGYHGLGDFGPGQGWMVGQSHKVGTDQPKLELAIMPNNKIEDFRSTLKPEPLSSFVGFGAGGFAPDTGPSKIPTKGLGANYKNVLGLRHNFLSPFQKENRKYLQKIGGAPATGEGAHTLFDNDDEYSKLYVCRDIDNNARGLFFINFENLLKNNSYLWPTMFPPDVNLPVQKPFKDEILAFSKILELRLYRDRVKKHVINTYEKFANDTFYEEPSQLVGKISDKNGYNSPIQSPELAELSLGGINGDSFSNRFFMFSDTFPGSHSSGKYQYRVELDFKDGTYHFLSNLLKHLQIAKVNLESYYDLATSGFTEDGLTIEYSTGYVGHLKDPDSYVKRNFKTYFDDAYGSFRPEFIDAAYKQFLPDDKGYQVWGYPPSLITKMQKIFNIFPAFDVNETQILAMIDPSSGSPKGIQFFIRMLATCITKLEKLTGTTKVNKKSNLNKVSLGPNTFPQYDLSVHFDYDISSSEAMIHEEHTFDHPNEIFESVQNENVHVDYLSIGLPLTTNFYGLRSLSPEYFDSRCVLDALKFSDAALTDFHGKFGPQQEGNGNIAMFMKEGNSTIFDKHISPDSHDSLSQTAYSFLTPSIVTLADPAAGIEAYNFHHSSFSPEALNLGNRYSNSTAPLDLLEEQKS